MIPLKRVRTAPPVHANFQRAGREQLNMELMEDRRAALKSGGKQKFSSGHWRQAKDQLLEESSDKCAYCEAPTAVVAYGDVEHYRPKSKYWWLAYCYDNYLASCQLCNQKYKKAKFPHKNAAMKPPVKVRSNSTDAFLGSRKAQLSPDALSATEVAAFEAAHRVERPFIVNPYVDMPATWFAWEEDEFLRRVKLVPAQGVADAAEFVTAAEQDLGLNRVELQELRYAEFEKFRAFKLALKDPGISAATKAAIRPVVQSMLADDAPFAGMLRFFDPSL